MINLNNFAISLGENQRKISLLSAGTSSVEIISFVVGKVARVSTSQYVILTRSFRICY